MNFQLDTDNLENIDKIDDSEKLFSILLGVMKKLRSPEGCMWDREQNHKTIKRNLIEETYEAVESIDNEDFDGLKEELGDLMLQVVFHSQIAAENKNFDINQVLRGVINKLVRRHPHVFKGLVLKDSKEVLASWEEIKKKEKKEKSSKPASVFSGIPRSLPSLHFASEIQTRASRLGFDWNDKMSVFKKLEEEIGEMKQEVKEGSKNNISGEIGDVIFTIVNFSRHAGIDCEESLYETSRRFIKRFDFMEKYAEEKNLNFKKLSLEEKDKIWEIAKKEII
jgi:tetrapyrrole methylase family protein / MazG family protein